VAEHGSAAITVEGFGSVSSAKTMEMGADSTPMLQATNIRQKHFAMVYA